MTESKLKAILKVWANTLNSERHTGGTSDKLAPIVAICLPVRLAVDVSRHDLLLQVAAH